MINKQFNLIELNDFEQLQENAVSESKTIEYKTNLQQIPMAIKKGVFS